MIQELKIKNLSTNLVLTLNRSDSQYVLDDNSPDWGTVQSSSITYPLLSSNIGVGLTKVNLNSPRTITITAWVYRNQIGTIESKKEFLNTFCNPFDQLRITTGDYEIDGYFSQPVVYSDVDSLNNDCVCKFLLYITCPFPLFNKMTQNSNADNQDKLINGFYFPLVLPSSSSFVFGSRVITNQIEVLNSGTVSVGAVFNIRTISDITGLKLTLGNKEFSLKPSYILPRYSELKISTVSGDMGIWLKNSNTGQFEPAFDIVNLVSDWFQIPVGLSVIHLSCDSGSVLSIEISVSIKELFYAMEEQ